jgi:hypothetical protein
MRALDGELDVDVLVIGSGLMAHYLARQLVGRYTVALVIDPTMPNETLDDEGYISAGFDGNDVGRIQPARRAAGYWRLWAESSGLDFDDRRPGCAVPTDAVARTIRLWDDAALTFHPTSDWPPIFDDGPLIDNVFYNLDNDVVLDPAAVLGELRSGLAGHCIEGQVAKFVMSPGATVEYVEVEVDGQLVEVAPRYTVLAAAAANATYLNQVAMRLRDPSRRKQAAETSNTCQAIRQLHVIAIRGSELPRVSGHYGGLRITSHPLPPPDDRVWLVNPPADRGRTTVGPEDLRFDPAVDPALVRETLDELLSMSPELAAAAHQLAWSVYVRRQTQHPMIAGDDASRVGQPVPAKIESLDIDGFLALWPSHESFAMIVGDVAAERIRTALRDPEEYDGLSVADAAAPDDRPYVSRWRRDDFAWSDWESFASHHAYKPSD